MNIRLSFGTLGGLQRVIVSVQSIYFSVLGQLKVETRHFWVGRFVVESLHFLGIIEFLLSKCLFLRKLDFILSDSNVYL